MKLNRSYFLILLVFTLQLALNSCSLKSGNRPMEDSISNDSLYWGSQVEENNEVENKSEYKLKTIGNTIGLVSLSHEVICLDNIEMLNDNGTIWMSFDYKFEEKLGETSYTMDDIKNLYPTWKDNFNPWAFKIDYYYLVFRCIAEDSDYYTVVVDEDNKLSKRLKKGKYFKLETWEQHLFQCIIGLYPSSQLKNNPNEGASIVLSSNDAPYQAMEVKGDWVKVQNIESENEQGWLKWRNGDELLVEFYYSM